MQFVGSEEVMESSGSKIAQAAIGRIRVCIYIHTYMCVCVCLCVFVCVCMCVCKFNSSV